MDQARKPDLPTSDRVDPSKQVHPFVTEGSTFSLTPQEEFAHGVSLVDGVLRFGPSGTQLIRAVLTFIVGGFVATGGVISSYSNRSLVGVGVAIAALIYVVAVGSSLIATRVTADETGLRAKTLWRRQRIPWSEVADIVAADSTPRRWSIFAGPHGVRMQMRLVASWSQGLVTLKDGRVIELPGFVAAAQGEGLSLGSPTTTELKVQALNRFRDSVSA